MDLYEKLEVPREEGVTRCGILDLMLASCREGARAFALFETINDEIDAQAARRIIVRLLHQYGVLPGAGVARRVKAEQVANTFLQLIAPVSARYFTNGTFDDRGGSWNAATPSAMDTGVLVLGERQVACIWYQNDD
jgi:hypothetical protein